MSDLPITPPIPPRDLPFRRPADYYEAPLSEVRPIFPKWVPIGCGSLAAVFLGSFFALGAFIASGRGGPIVASLFDLMHKEMNGQIAKDVAGRQRAAFNEAFDRVTQGIREGRVNYSRLQPFLQSMQAATGDETIDSKEIDELTKRLQDVMGPKR